MPEIGDIVRISSVHYGKIIGFKMHFRSGPAGRPAAERLYNVRYIDNKTGKLMVCPDSRCGASKTGGTANQGCPICRRNLWSDELSVLNARDLKYYVNEGMIDKSLLKS